MKNLVFIMAMLMAISCTTSRNVRKTTVSIDSTSVKKENAGVKSNEALTIETKNVSLVIDTARTKADSAKTNFSFNPSDTTNDLVEVELETGSIKAKASFNKKTGKGSLEAKKKSEDIPVNRYQENTSKVAYSNNDSSWKEGLDSNNYKKTATGKTSDKKTSSWLWITISLVLLAVLLAGYFWLRNQYVNPKRILP